MFMEFTHVQREEQTRERKELRDEILGVIRDVADEDETTFSHEGTPRSSRFARSRGRASDDRSDGTGRAISVRGLDKLDKMAGDISLQDFAM